MRKRKTVKVRRVRRRRKEKRKDLNRSVSTLLLLPPLRRSVCARTCPPYTALPGTLEAVSVKG